MTKIAEIAADVYRLSTFVPQIDLQFSQFLVRDDEPVLVHTGLRAMFQDVRDAVARLLPPQSIRHVLFSHYEADECGSLREWQALAPRAEAGCSVVGKLVSVDDCAAARPARGLADGETFSTGRYRWRFVQTPHVPHGWDAGLFFEETQRTLFCSDLMGHLGDVEPLTQSDVVGRFEHMARSYEGGPFANYLPWTTQTQPTLERLAALEPRTLATMHGSAYAGDGAAAMRAMASALRDVHGVE